MNCLPFGSDVMFLNYLSCASGCRWRSDSNLITVSQTRYVGRNHRHLVRHVTETMLLEWTMSGKSGNRSSPVAHSEFVNGPWDYKCMRSTLPLSDGYRGLAARGDGQHAGVVRCVFVAEYGDVKSPTRHVRPCDVLGREDHYKRCFFCGSAD